MKPVSPEEISALLDNELSPQRAAEVRRAIAEDGELRRVYEQLADLDGDLGSYAVACQFTPQVALPSRPKMLNISIWAVAFGLLAVRILARAVSFGPGVGIELAALVFVLAWLFHWLLPGLRDDQWQVVHELGKESA
ncbi:MAG: anti-sigma factor family protein [Thermoguttaceae bacterium]|jgi:anti-sigma factor RsiW